MHFCAFDDLILCEYTYLGSYLTFLWHVYTSCSRRGRGMHYSANVNTTGSLCDVRVHRNFALRSPVQSSLNRYVTLHNCTRYYRRPCARASASDIHAHSTPCHKVYKDIYSSILCFYNATVIVIETNASARSDARVIAKVPKITTSRELRTSYL